MSDDASLLRSFRAFNERGGKFRVAVLNVCNLDCFFCHNEAMPNPRRGEVASKALGDAELLAIMNAFTALGGRQLNVTGGEPLAHPRLLPLLAGLDKRGTRVVLNSNAILAERLLAAPKLAQIDAIFASVHTTDAGSFKSDLGGRDVAKLLKNVVALRDHGYEVQLNFSLGAYNRRQFGAVLGFAVANRLPLKAIALVRSDEREGFYGGDWVDPAWLQSQLEQAGGRPAPSEAALGGHSTTWDVRGVPIKVKNIARGRLRTGFCDGCAHEAACGEGIYGLRVGVDGWWKPCLLRRERFAAVRNDAPYRRQILELIDAMMGAPERQFFAAGAPA